MADISNYLNQIKTAIKGEDVRGAIHDAIEQCYTDGQWDVEVGDTGHGLVDKLARDKIDQFLNQGTGQANEVQLWPEEGSDSTIYCEMSFQLNYDPSQYDVIRVYYKVVASGNPQIFEFPASEFANGPSVIAGIYYEGEANPCPISGRRINIQPIGGTDKKAFEAYNVSRWNWNGNVTDTEQGTNNARSSEVDGAAIQEGYPVGQIVKITGIKYADISNALLNFVGVKDELETTDKSSIVAAINEVNSKASTSKVSVTENQSSGFTTIRVEDGESYDDYALPNFNTTGFTGSLQTNVKTTLVAAINELKGLIDSSDTSVSDGSITTPKLADHAVSMDKTDFYYNKSLSHDYSWVYFGTGTTRHRIYFEWAQMDIILEEFPEILSIVIPNVADYWTSGGQSLTIATTSHTEYIPKETSTITVGGVKYGIIKILRSDFEEDYNALKEYVDQGESWKQTNYMVTNASSRIPDGPPKYFVSGEVTAAMIEANFSETVMSEDFATAVKRALESEEGTTTDEETAKNRLTGKVMVCLGDSYTAGMNSLLSSVASKYGMVLDNRGVVSSSICGDVSGNKGFSPMWNRANTIVSNYASGYVINETTYTANDVGVITFMGGANDGYGVETWIGTGIHETDKEKIYGACNHIFNVLAENFPKAKLICITQPSHYKLTVSSITDDATAQTLGFENLAELQGMTDVQLSAYSMAQKENAVRNSALMHGWNIVDMFNDMPTVFNPSNRSAYWQSDKLHLTNAGYTLISKAVDKKIVELVVG